MRLLISISKRWVIQNWLRSCSCNPHNLIRTYKRPGWIQDFDFILPTQSQCDIYENLLTFRDWCKNGSLCPSIFALSTTPICVSMINTKHLPDAMSLVSFMVVFVFGPNSAALRGGIFEIGTQRVNTSVGWPQFHTHSFRLLGGALVTSDIIKSNKRLIADPKVPAKARISREKCHLRQNSVNCDKCHNLHQNSTICIKTALFT